MDVFYELAIRQSSKLFPVEHKDFFLTDCSTVSSDNGMVSVSMFCRPHNAETKKPFWENLLDEQESIRCHIASGGLES